MKRIVISCIIAVLLCVGCRENPKNTNDEKSEITSSSKDSRETSSEAVVTKNITSKVTENKTETVSTTVSTKKSSDNKEFIVTEKIQEKTEATTIANDDIPPDITESTVAEITQESEETTVFKTKPEVIELPFVPVG
ncbi:MAG: hypothetical protein K2K14_00815 [Ruminococcus sp.]|nr:hypothetical protein [Ruminococcus sp.]